MTLSFDPGNARPTILAYDWNSAAYSVLLE
jgi:hypothetical protein